MPTRPGQSSSREAAEWQQSQSTVRLENAVFRFTAGAGWQQGGSLRGPGAVASGWQQDDSKVGIARTKETIQLRLA